MSSESTRLRLQPALALVLTNLFVFVMLALAAEVFLRLCTTYNPSYYTAISATSREVTYGYGRIPINSAGFPDREFELRRIHRVGYFGDSVTYGVGAGYGYRISDVLRDAYPDREHLTFAKLGISISEGRIAYFRSLAKAYCLDEAVYLLNLNDIVPDDAATGERTSSVRTIQGRFFSRFDSLRGRSYLYTYVRHIARSFLEVNGIGSHGYVAYELYPRKNADILRQTAMRIVAFERALREVGTTLTVVVLPYEMQISTDAETTYRSLGVRWEDGFIDRGPQRLLFEYLPPDIRVIDAYYAFGDGDNAAAWRARNKLGQFFVYNRGDKLDWNHPNREGHRAIANFLIRNAILATHFPATRPHAP